MKDEIELDDEVMEKLAADVERELAPEIEEFLESCKGKNLSYRERGTLKLRQKFGELLMARAAAAEQEMLGPKKMSSM